MSRLYRVFGASVKQPPPELVLEYLLGLGVTGKAHFRGDDAGWTALEFSPIEGATPLAVDCFLSSEDGIRQELNAWAAWLETREDSPHHAALMERIIQTKQLYVLRQADKRVCEMLCRWLAQATGGVYQHDGEGFFAADGTLLLQED
jgi:hypothetical protein